MKGAPGFLLTGFFWMSAISNACFRMSLTYPSAVVPSPMTGSFPATLKSLAKNGSFDPVRNSPMTDQYSSGMNEVTASSRSQIRRTATDWTRPAESP